jgi:hypothetical protein
MSQLTQWSKVLRCGRAAFAGLAVLSIPAAAATPTVWIGPSGASWFDAVNWSGGVPDVNTHA